MYMYSHTHTHTCTCIISSVCHSNYHPPVFYTEYMKGQAMFTTSFITNSSTITNKRHPRNEPRGIPLYSKYHKDPKKNSNNRFSMEC